MKAEYIQHMGSDLTVVNAARVSFDKESEWETEDVTEAFPDDREYIVYRKETLSERDGKLIRYLADHNHWTPFAHNAVTLRETVPIFVARQRFKHTVGFSYNEVSRRYVDSPPEFYTPDKWRARAENKKQGSSDEEVDLSDINPFWTLKAIHRVTLNAYNEMIKRGVAPEQARMVLPQSMYTSYYVTGSLAAFARAYRLRIDPHAQVEIQELAKEWDRIIRPLFPVSWSALVD